MARTYKWLGGIGYVLGLVPYVSFISSILVAIAWILMGKDTREKIFTILGVLTLVMFAFAIALVAFAATLFLSFLMAGYAAGAAVGQVLSRVWGLIAVALVLVGLAIAVFVLDIVAHFRAGKIFDNRWFKVAGWMRIILIIVAVVAIPLTIFMILSAGPGMFSMMPALPDYGAIMSLLLTVFWPLIIVLIVSLLATIFSIIAFFTIPEEAPPTPPSVGPMGQ